MSGDAASMECSNCYRSFSSQNGIPLLFWPNEWDSQDDVTDAVKAFYEENPFPNYERMDSAWSLREKAEQGVFARLLDDQIPHGARLLEVGCGTGQLSNFLGMRWGRTIFGTDLCMNSLNLGEDFKNSADFREHSKEIRSIMTPQFHFDIGINGGIESDQDFTSKNYTYGLQALIDYKVWNPESSLAKFNLLDIPFAALRLLTGYDDHWQVRGSTYPTLLLAVDQVEPDGTPRDMVGDDSSYARFRAEVSFRTPLAWFNNSQLFFNANYRVYYRLESSLNVKTADPDDFDYLSLSLTSDKGFVLTYTSGMLPFGVTDVSSLEAGWRFHL